MYGYTGAAPFFPESFETYGFTSQQQLQPPNTRSNLIPVTPLATSWPGAPLPFVQTASVNPLQVTAKSTGSPLTKTASGPTGTKRPAPESNNTTMTAEETD